MHSRPLLLTGRKKNNFFAERDEAGNVLIRKPATVGMETPTQLSYKHI